MTETPDILVPPALNGPALSIIPLGGIGEIGLNMTVLEYGDDIIVIDAGLMFPDAEMLGVDIVIPDFTYLLENRDKVRAVRAYARARGPHRRAPVPPERTQGPHLRHEAHPRLREGKAPGARP